MASLVSIDLTTWNKQGVVVAGDGTWTVTENNANSGHGLSLTGPGPNTAGSYCFQLDYKGIGPTPRSVAIECFDKDGGYNGYILQVDPDGSWSLQENSPTTITQGMATVTKVGDFYRSKLYVALSATAATFLSVILLPVGTAWYDAGYQGLDDGSGASMGGVFFNAVSSAVSVAQSSIIAGDTDLATAWNEPLVVSGPPNGILTFDSNGNATSMTPAQLRAAMGL